MNTVHIRFLPNLLRQCVVASSLLVIGAVSASAAEPSDASASCPTGIHSNRVARLAAQADQGPAALRRYTERTYPIYLVDVPTANAQIARFRQIEAACQATAASK